MPYTAKVFYSLGITPIDPGKLYVQSSFTTHVWFSAYRGSGVSAGRPTYC